MVGKVVPGRVELPTSTLSVWRSNQLSYRTGLPWQLWLPGSMRRVLACGFRLSLPLLLIVITWTGNVDKRLCALPFLLRFGFLESIESIDGIESIYLAISCASFVSFLVFRLQKGGVPAAPSGTATLLRLSPNHQLHPRPLLALADFRCHRLSWLDGRCVQGPGTYSPRHG